MWSTPTPRRQNRRDDLYHCHRVMALALVIGLTQVVSAAPAMPDFSQIETAADEEFLPVEQAFQLEVTAIDGEAASQLTWHIADGYSLYKSRIKVLESFPASTIKTLQFQGTPVWKQDPNFGKVEVFHQQVSSTLALTGAPQPTVDNVNVILEYQGCADTGLCFPPVQTEILVPSHPDLLFATEPPSTQLQQRQATVETVSAQSSSNHLVLIERTSSPSASQADGLAGFLADASLPLMLLTLLVLGIGLAFTPCVFPMMPILSGLIAGEQREKLSGWRGFQLSLAYVLGMATTYAALGTLMGYFGARANLQLWLQQPVVLVAFSLLFVVLALSMFGLFTLQLPNAVRQRLDRLSNQQRGGRLSSVALMGSLSALVVSPCVSAPLAGVLLYISSTGDAVTGGLALFALGLGMGVPLIILGTTSAKLLPRAGGWMDQVKNVFGIGLLAVAVWLLSRIVAGEVALLLWAGLWLGTAVTLGALEPAAAGWPRLQKAIGVGLLVYAVLLMIGGLTGQDNPYRPLDAFMQPQTNQAHTPTEVEFNVMDSPTALTVALIQAKQAGQPVLIDVAADWCAACTVMQRSTFRDSRVIDALSGYQKLQLDLSKNTPEQRQWLQAQHLYGPPALLFFDVKGNEVQRIQSEVNATDLLAKLP
ncbi:MAG: protein-disulfide reductase DsbD [Pseudomonadota bacterium]|nr:protein-disulfide reductase DsbD [Pseudomonadota bacterium]